ncbi:hypothetical protein QR680_007871 [Steinernema hermaphroditum]|uniref:Uncharacterized protein n=1 Tax=Steinernema hermaphroditum TaxID=289476 RepID=A0AA39IFX4_9BILA|nr:hypothetical protein QR680_007871 [Steinernema hermaphroditum]
MRDLNESDAAANGSAQPGITAAISSVSNPELESLLSSLITGKPQTNGVAENGHRNGEVSSESEEEKKLTTVEELAASLQYLQHQMNRILDAMKIDPCSCASCSRRDGSMCQKERPQQSQTPASQASSDSSPPVQNPSNGSMDAGTSLLMQIFQNQQNGHASSPAVNGNGVAPNKAPLPPSVTRTSNAGRRSKYCTPEEKRLVAEYAHMHGASAAARKFNIPPAIASYYYKREMRNAAPRESTSTPLDDIADLLPTHSGDTPGPESAPPTPVKKDSFKMDLSNPAHTSGSPGFLRGRGRGRPKLIGDELDAELVEHMVNIKNHEGHLTASQALEFARDFIMQKQPGLLVEQGGHVSLKITWAMKLVSRIAERQKEIEMGLQAGALATMHKQANLPDASLLEQHQMTELLKQMSANALANAGNGLDLEMGASGEEGEPDDDTEDPTETALDGDTHYNTAIPGEF